MLISANQWEAFKEWSSPPPWTKVIIGLISNISFIRTIIAISKTEQLTFSLQSRTRNSTPCYVGRKVGNHRYCNPMGRVAGKKIRRGGGLKIHSIVYTPETISSEINQWICFEQKLKTQTSGFEPILTQGRLEVARDDSGPEAIGTIEIRVQVLKILVRKLTDFLLYDLYDSRFYLFNLWIFIFTGPHWKSRLIKTFIGHPWDR